MTNFVFVGERPSIRAANIGATWQNGKLAGKTLRSTLEALNIDPMHQKYLNLYTQARPCDRDALDEVAAVRAVTDLVASGYVVVGMGQIVSRRLTFHGVGHLMLIHPAARGAIRRRDRYVAHVASVLCELG